MIERQPLCSAGVAVLLLAGAGACGPDSATRDVMGSGGAGGTTPMAGSSSGRGGVAGSGAGDVGTGGNTVGGSSSPGGAMAVGGSSSATHFGQMALLNQLLQSHATVNASFVSAQTDGGAKCTSVTDAGCVVSTCSDGAPANRTYASAGTLTITSPELTGSITDEPDADGQYSMVATSTLEHLFYGGETAVFKASGGTVPAFEEQLSSPLILLLSAPLFTKGTARIEAPRTQDLAMTWTRGVPGVMLYLTGSGARPDGMPGFTGMTCQLPSETGTAVIKTSLLQQLAAETSLSIYTVVTKNITAGDYAVVLALVTAVGNPDKNIIPSLLLH